MATQITIRRLAIAALAGASVALVCDALLEWVLTAVDIAGTSRRWPGPRPFARSVWIVASALVWLIAPFLAARLEPDETVVTDSAMARPTAIRLVGLAAIVTPLLWVIATWLAAAARITLGGDWAVDGRVWLEPAYYSALVVDNGPWVLAGAALLAWARHEGLSRRAE